jgi:hypothetical protein
MIDGLKQEVIAGDFILHVDTRNDFSTLGIFTGYVTPKGRPHFLRYYQYGNPEERVKKECASNYFIVIKITEEQFRQAGTQEEIIALLEVKENL